MIIVKDVRILNPKDDLDTVKSIIIKEGLINKLIDYKDIEEDILSDDNVKVIDGENLVAAPGLIDIHVHFRDPGMTHKEDIITGSKSAAAGGVTSVICMANTNPIVDDVEDFKYFLERSKEAVINVYQSSAITKGFRDKELVDFDAMYEMGAKGFTNDGTPIMNTGLLAEAMKEAKRLDVVLAMHEEDNSLIGVAGVNDGEVSRKLGIKGAPVVAEDIMVARDCLMAEYYGCKIDIQHISSGRAVQIVREAQKRGAKVYAEASPHHFTLTEDDVLTHGTLAKMNPPLRTSWDRDEIIKGLKDNTISIIATDHAPHAADEKSREFRKSPSGIIGLETSLALGITELVEKGHISLMELLRKMTINPSLMYDLGRGDLSENMPADIVIFDPKEKWTPKEFKSKSSNSPFVGRELTGKVKYTICRGNLVYQDNE